MKLVSYEQVIEILNNHIDFYLTRAVSPEGIGAVGITIDALNELRNQYISSLEFHFEDDEPKLL